MSLGQQILKLRKTKGWNQDTLGEKLGIHANHVSRLEHDRMKPSKRTLVRLAEVFEVSAKVVLEEEAVVAEDDDDAEEEADSSAKVDA